MNFHKILNEAVKTLAPTFTICAVDAADERAVKTVQ